VARETRSSRARAAEAAWRIVEEEVAHFLKDRAERRAAPALQRLRGHFEAARLEALARAPNDAAAATRWLVNRLLHRPSAALRSAAAGGESLEDAAVRLFGLEAEKGQGAASASEDGEGKS